MGRMVRWMSVVLSGALLAAGGAAAYLLCTTAGSSWLIRSAMTRYIRAKQTTIHRIQGNLLKGLTFEGVVIEDLAVLPPGNALVIDRLDAALSLMRPWQSPVQAHVARLHLPSMAEQVTLAKLEGNLLGGFTMYDVELAGIAQMPKGTTVAIQRLELAHLAEIRSDVRRARVTIHNGRLNFPNAEPAVVYGRYLGGRLDLHAYTRILTPEELRPFFPNSLLLRVSEGHARDANVHLSGTWERPELTGEFWVDRLSRRGFTLMRAPGTFKGYFTDLGHGTHVYGDLLLSGGSISSKDVTIALRPSHILFAGDPKVPRYDMRGTSTVANTTIRITLTGTRTKPELALSSSPPLPEERLLVMLATGRSLAGAETTLGKGRVSSDLAADFIDYFVLGGQGSRVAQLLGITGLSLIYEPETNMVGVKTTLADKVALTYEAEQTRQQPPGTTGPTLPSEDTSEYKVGAEYKITGNTSLVVEGERETTHQPGTSTASTAPVDGTTQAAPQTRDEVYLKLERRF